MTDPLKIEPALSAEQWAAKRIDCPNGATVEISTNEQRAGALLGSCENCVTWLHGIEARGERHGIAALALHGQPFGFTADEAEIMERLAEYGEIATWTTLGDGRMVPCHATVETIAKKIRALVECASPSTHGNTPEANDR